MPLTNEQLERIERLERTGRILRIYSAAPTPATEYHIFMLEPDTDDSRDIRVEHKNLRAFLANMLESLRDAPSLPAGYTIHCENGAWKVRTTDARELARGESKPLAVCSALALISAYGL